MNNCILFIIVVFIHEESYFFIHEEFYFIHEESYHIQEELYFNGNIIFFCKLQLVSCESVFIPDKLFFSFILNFPEIPEKRPGKCLQHTEMWILPAGSR